MHLCLNKNYVLYAIIKKKKNIIMIKEFREHPLYERFKLRYPVLPAVPPRHNHRQLPAPPGKI